jgi:hypothetical protein
MSYFSDTTYVARSHLLDKSGISPGNTTPPKRIDI